MLQPELKFRRDKIRYLMAQQGIDAALIACNVNLLYTYGEIVNCYLYLPLHSPALLFVKRPNNIVGEFVFPIRKPEQIGQKNYLLASILLICARILAIVPPDTSRLAKGSNDLMKAAFTI